jgi:hypothetical protein
MHTILDEIQYIVIKYIMFATVRHFHPSLIFASKALSYTSELNIVK